MSGQSKGEWRSGSGRGKGAVEMRTVILVTHTFVNGETVTFHCHVWEKESSFLVSSRKAFGGHQISKNYSFRSQSSLSVVR